MTRKLTILLLAGTLLGGCAGRGGIFPAGQSSSDGGPPDDGGDWTILLCVLQDPVQHVQHAERYRSDLSGKLGWKGVFVINKGGHSEVYWGRYRTPAHAQKNLRKAKAHTTLAGTRPFDQAMLIPLPGGDVGPAELNLRNAPGAYTFVVAIFQDDPELNYIGRKQFAVAYCKRLRKGNYEAYFYHGPGISYVTIGAFGEQAVRVKKGPEGDKFEVLDASVRELEKDFPHLQVNGTGVNDLAWDPRERKIIRIPLRTYLMPSPRGRETSAP